MSDGPHCPYCGSTHFGRVRGLQGATEVMIGVLLLLAGLFPGVIYYIWREGMPYCSTCGRRVAKSYLRAPRGQPEAR